MYKLLIADDEPEIRNSLSNYFPWNEVGFEVCCTANNGKKALQCIDESKIDVLLCDIKMPIMNGIEVARELHSRSSPIKIIFLSGFKDFHYAQQAIIYGVKNYIVKPTKYYELIEVFQRLKTELDRDQQPASNSDSRKGSHQQPEVSIPDKIIATIKEYINDNYKNATLESSADLVHMNPYYISKFFKNKSGENFSDYLIRIRMNKAAELLQDYNFKIYEVSELVGYSSTKHFTRTFKKTFGKNPKEYRNLE